MSIVWSNQHGWILSHSSFLYDLYNSVSRLKLCQKCGKYSIFHISHPFLRKNQKTVKNSEMSNDISGSDKNGEAVRVHKYFSEFVGEAKGLQKWPQNDCSSSNSNNDVAVGVAVNVLKTTEYTKHFRNFHGGNANSYSISVEFENEKYFIPPRCTFYCCDVFELKDKLSDSAHNRFDVIVIDPPWRNKHVRRKNWHSSCDGYTLMTEVNLVGLQVDNLLSLDGLIAVWCTNSEQQTKCLLEEVFPSWNVHYAGTWYWIKVTETGEPVCNFSDLKGKKQPFEKIIFGCRAERSAKYKNPDSNKLVVSIPSSIHSHKPPLSNILVDYVPTNAAYLELFARYLMPGWISCGNEVLKLQHHSLFT